MLVVFKKNNNSVGIVKPVNEYVKEYGIEYLAKTDVPAGSPYWIVDSSEIPTDRTFRDAWEIPDEWGEPDGYGSEFTTFEGVLNAENQSE